MAAAALGARRGFDAISMADIGAEAGIVGSGVYRHFDSKKCRLRNEPDSDHEAQLKLPNEADFDFEACVGNCQTNPKLTS